VTLPNPIEAAVQEMERLGRDVCVKIDEAVNSLINSDDDLHLDDPLVYRSATDLQQASRRIRSLTRVPAGTPPDGSPPTDEMLPPLRKATG
jgi:hypothetical protein